VTDGADACVSAIEILADMKKKVILKRVFHRGKWRILISFPIDSGLSILVRQVEGSRYSNTHKSWYADDNEETLKQVFKIFRDKADIDISALTAAVEPDEIPPSEEDTKAESSIRREETSVPENEPEESRLEIIPAKRIIEKVIERPRFSPVEFRINEEDGITAKNGLMR